MSGTRAPRAANLPEPPSGSDRPPAPRPPSPPRLPRWLDVCAAVSWRLLLIAAASLAAIWLLTRLYLAVLPILLGLLLATLLAPPARWLEARGMPRLLATIITVPGAVILSGFLIALLVPQITEETQALAGELDVGLQTILQGIAEFTGISMGQIEELIETAGQRLQDNAETITAGILTGAVLAVEVVVGLVLTLVLAFFFVRDGERLAGWMLDRASSDPERRETLEAVGKRAWTTLSGFLRGQAIVAAADAVGIGIGLLILGVPLVVPLVVLTFIGGFFPIVGAFVAGLAAVLVALVSGGLVDALLVLAIVVAVQQLESNVLAPMVLGRVMRLHPVVVLVALTVGSVLAGVIGAFLAVPIAAVAAAVGNELRLREVV